VKVGWRLALSVALWAVAFPVIGVLTSVLARTVYPTIITDWLPVPLAWTAMILWGLWIYWRCVPSTSSIPRRVMYLALFAVLMVIVGILALDFAIVLVVVIFGV
jgi:hypothetical protein